MTRPNVLISGAFFVIRCHLWPSLLSTHRLVVRMLLANLFPVHQIFFPLSQSKALDILSQAMPVISPPEPGSVCEL